MTHYIKIIKVITLLFISYVFYLLFVLNFTPITINNLLFKNSYIDLFFVAFLYSGFIVFNAVVYFTQDSKKYIWFTLVLFLLGTASGTFLITNDLNKSFILSFFSCLGLISSTFIPLFFKNRYVNLEAFIILKKTIKYSLIFLALVFSLSFYFFEGLDISNINTKFLIDRVINTSSFMPSTTSTKTNSEQTNDTKLIQQKIQEQISTLSGENLEYYLQNKQLIDGIFNSYLQNSLSTASSDIASIAQNQIVTNANNTLENFVTKYRQYILVIGAILIYFAVNSVFFIANFVITPLYLIIFKLLIKTDLLKKSEQTIKVKRLNI